VKPVQLNKKNFFNILFTTEIGIISVFTLLLFLIERLTVKIIVFFSGTINMGSPKYLNLSFIDQLFWTVIMGPIAETVIFHFILIEILIFIFRQKAMKNFFVVIISAFFFGLSHYYSIEYIIITFVSGLVLSTAYILAKNRNMLPFVVVYFIHALFNLISLMEFGYKNELLFNSYR